jgi:hypothetical protein
MFRGLARLGAMPVAAIVFLLATAPAYAASPVSQATATALSGQVAGNGTDSGTVIARHDGHDEQKTGDAHPPVDVLGNQQLLNVGVLAQEATADVDDEGFGTSRACAGIAGNGGSVAQVGDARCLEPGAPVGLSIANLDLTDAVLFDPQSALAPLGQLQPVIDQVVGPVTAAVSDNLTPLGETGLAGTLGVVEASCTAGPDGLTGSANIVDSKIALSLAGTTVEVVDLPVNPPPNTEVLVDLDVVATGVLDAIRDDLNTTLDGQLAPLTAAIDPVQKQIVDNALAQVGPQLAPLSQNVLRIVLNKQTKADDRIEVTAMTIDVLPAAAAQLDGASLGSAQIGHVSCGPNGRIVTEREVAPDTEPKPRPPAALPTAVAAGVEPEPWYDDLALPGVLVVMAAGAGLLRRWGSDPT